MSLEKLTLLTESTTPGSFDTQIQVLFNPERISIQKHSKWGLVPLSERDTQGLEFLHGEPAILSLELFFDTSESRTDVRGHTRPIFGLTTIEGHGDLHRPPVCRLRWGHFHFDDFCWLLRDLEQTFTLFLTDGTPVRATLDCTFVQWRSDEVEKKLLKLSSPDVAKTWTVRRGETLSAIAAEAYDDASLWRPIARANALVDPRRLRPGQVLAIPALGPEESR